MGGTFYSASSRSLRSEEKGYATKSREELFSQTKERKSHDSMNPRGVIIRESRDSVAHPKSVPIILELDVTGSMLGIPHYLLKEGLPKIMESIIAAGIPDPQILFVAIGDHVYDSYPLQIGQFESGDAELDMWLERTYPEGGGGGNKGESYHLGYYFAANHTVTDSWEKRKQKGFLFSIGDEPCLDTLPASVIKEVMGAAEAKDWTFDELLKATQEKYHVYHLHMMEGNAGARSLGFWKEKLGQNCIEIKHQEDVANAIKDIVVEFSKTTETVKSKPTETISTKEEIYL